MSGSNSDLESVGTFLRVLLPSSASVGSRRIRGVDWASGLEEKRASKLVSYARGEPLSFFPRGSDSLELCGRLVGKSGRISALGSMDISSLRESSKFVGVRMIPLDPGRSEKGSVELDFLLRIDRPSSATGLRGTLP